MSKHKVMYKSEQSSEGILKTNKEPANHLKVVVNLNLYSPIFRIDPGSSLLSIIPDFQGLHLTKCRTLLDLTAFCNAGENSLKTLSPPVSIKSFCIPLRFTEERIKAFDHFGSKQKKSIQNCCDSPSARIKCEGFSADDNWLN